jgi:hypothetical protein
LYLTAKCTKNRTFLGLLIAIIFAKGHFVSYPRIVDMIYIVFSIEKCY